MAYGDSEEDEALRFDAAISAVSIPLQNLEFTLDQFLRLNGCRLDTETRIMLASARDCVARAAITTRRISRRSARSESDPLRRIA